MAYSNEEKIKLVDHITERIMNGERLKHILLENNMPKAATLFSWFVKDKNLLNQYARAMEIRADLVFDEMLEIADNNEKDHTPFTGGNVVQRDKLRVDTRKWMLSKMNPKKYSDKLDLTSKGNSITDTKTVIEFRDYTGKQEEDE